MVLAYYQEFDNIFSLYLLRAKDTSQSSVIVHEINNGDIEWCIISLQIFWKEGISSNLFQRPTGVYDRACHFNSKWVIKKKRKYAIYTLNGNEI